MAKVDVSTCTSFREYTKPVLGTRIIRTEYDIIFSPYPIFVSVYYVAINRLKDCFIIFKNALFYYFREDQGESDKIFEQNYFLLRTPKR